MLSNHCSFLCCGGFRLLCKWSGIGPAGVRSLGEGISKDLSLFYIMSHLFLWEGNSLTSIPHGLHLDTCVLLSFLKVWILYSICMVISMSIMSSGGVHEKYPSQSYNLVPGCKPFFSGNISCMSYTVSRGLLETKVMLTFFHSNSITSQIKFCFN